MTRSSLRPVPRDTVGRGGDGGRSRRGGDQGRDREGRAGQSAKEGRCCRHGDSSRLDLLLIVTAVQDYRTVQLADSCGCLQVIRKQKVLGEPVLSDTFSNLLTFVRGLKTSRTVVILRVKTLVATVQWAR